MTLNKLIIYNEDPKVIEYLNKTYESFKSITPNFPSPQILPYSKIQDVTDLIMDEEYTITVLVNSDSDLEKYDLAIKVWQEKSPRSKIIIDCDENQKNELRGLAALCQNIFFSKEK